jgi:hypothetical protein
MFATCSILPYMMEAALRFFVQAVPLLYTPHESGHAAPPADDELHHPDALHNQLKSQIQIYSVDHTDAVGNTQLTAKSDAYDTLFTIVQRVRSCGPNVSYAISGPGGLVRLGLNKATFFGREIAQVVLLGLKAFVAEVEARGAELAEEVPEAEDEALSTITELLVEFAKQPPSCHGHLFDKSITLLLRIYHAPHAHYNDRTQRIVVVGSVELLLAAHMLGSEKILHRVFR